MTDLYAWSPVDAGSLVAADPYSAAPVETVLEPPVFSGTITSHLIYIGQAFAANYGAYFEGADNYSITGLPLGFTFDTSTGKVSGKSRVEVNPYMTVTATNADGSATSNTFSWEIIKDPAARDVATAPAPTYRETDLQSLNRAFTTDSSAYATYEFTGRTFMARD